MLRMGVDAHFSPLTYALPLMPQGDRGLVIEMTDGTAEDNAPFRENVGFYYDLV